MKQFLLALGISIVVVLIPLVYCNERKAFTHFSEEELSFLDYYRSDTIFLFTSPNGHVDTLRYVGLKINNEEKGGSDEDYYLKSNRAYIRYNFNITHNNKKMKGYFYKKKLKEDSDSLFLVYRSYLSDIEYEDTLYLKKSNSASAKNDFNFKGEIIKDCLIIDSIGTERTYETYEDMKVDSYVISPRDGLIYYRMKSGEEYFRDF